MSHCLLRHPNLTYNPGFFSKHSDPWMWLMVIPSQRTTLLNPRIDPSDDYFRSISVVFHRKKMREMTSKIRPPKTTKPRMLNQKGEIGDLTASLPRFLMSFSDFPRRASCSLTNLAFRLRCSSVWAIVYVYKEVKKSNKRREASKHGMKSETGV